MNGDSYLITVAEGGFIVEENKSSDTSDDSPTSLGSYGVQRVFADSSGLINYLHNELAGSN